MFQYKTERTIPNAVDIRKRKYEEATKSDKEFHDRKDIGKPLNQMLGRGEDEKLTRNV